MRVVVSFFIHDVCTTESPSPELTLREKFLAANKAAERPQLEPGPSGSNNITHRIWLKKREPVSVERVVCRDTLESITCLNGLCTHFICRQRVSLMAEVANNNEGLFSLQCCQQQLPMDTFLGFLPGLLRATFSFKCAEAATPPISALTVPTRRV
ncbi:hypothetical protein J3R83DRAFT_10466 [Lanmaoa asiatica]|nr:hypothetical protein J3R83DRAFT_10466 [Lanmaoa asiatica]